ncbi:MAG: hypothetical protein ACXADH_11895, partial [Candidatus Kariarchaeaceae archaeon]
MEFMSLFNFSVILLALPLVALAFVAIKFVRNGISRLIVCGLFVVAMAITFLVPLELTSYPKSVRAEWFHRNLEEADLLWGGVHPDTFDIYVLLHWPGQDQPRYYKVDNFENEQGKMRMGEELQQAMKEAAENEQQGGSGKVTMNYPFLTEEEREAAMAKDGQEGENNEENNGENVGYE